MTWGKTPWGKGPWGAYKETIQVSPIKIIGITMISNTLVKVTLDRVVVADPHYYNVDTYTIQPHPHTSEPLKILKVLPVSVQSPELLTNTILLKTSTQNRGTTYCVSLDRLTLPDGSQIPGEAGLEALYKCRETKTERLMGKLPGHFDRDVESNISTLMASMGISDDLIGGSRRDRFPT